MPHGMPSPITVKPQSTHTVLSMIMIHALGAWLNLMMEKPNDMCTMLNTMLVKPQDMCTLNPMPTVKPQRNMMMV